jgi:hypothetical protein
MMITDFALSISRKAKDKQSGEGRVHIMKNRYGMDGLTYDARINIAIGSFELLAEGELEESSFSTTSASTSSTNNFSLTEMGQLRNMLMNQ